MMKISLFFALGSVAAADSLRGTQSAAPAQRPVQYQRQYQPPQYVVPGGRPSPTAEKKLIATWSLPLVLAAFLFVHLSDRKLPKWAGLLGCALGLYGAHISYGVLQEYVMTQPYSGPSEAYGTMPFPSVSFLVCANRIMATIFALVVVKYIEKKPLG